MLFRLTTRSQTLTGETEVNSLQNGTTLRIWAATITPGHSHHWVQNNPDLLPKNQKNGHQTISSLVNCDCFSPQPIRSHIKNSTSERNAHILLGQKSEKRNVFVVTGFRATMDVRQACVTTGTQQSGGLQTVTVEVDLNRSTLVK